MSDVIYWIEPLWLSLTGIDWCCEIWLWKLLSLMQIVIVFIVIFSSCPLSTHSFQNHKEMALFARNSDEDEYHQPDLVEPVVSDYCFVQPPYGSVSLFHYLLSSGWNHIATWHDYRKYRKRPAIAVKVRLKNTLHKHLWLGQLTSSVCKWMILAKELLWDSALKLLSEQFQVIAC